MGSPVEMGDRKKVDFFKLRRSKRSEKVVIANQHQGFRQLNHMYMYVYVIIYNVYVYIVYVYVYMYYIIYITSRPTVLFALIPFWCHIVQAGPPEDPSWPEVQLGLSVSFLRQPCVGSRSQWSLGRRRIEPSGNATIKQWDMYVYKYISIYIHTHTYIYTYCIYIYIYTHTVYIYIHTAYIYIYTHILYIYIYILHIYIYIHTVYIYIWVCPKMGYDQYMAIWMKNVLIKRKIWWHPANSDKATWPSNVVGLKLRLR